MRKTCYEMDHRRYYHPQASHGQRYIVKPLGTPQLEITGENYFHTGLQLYEAGQYRGDPDHETIGQVLARLENYQHHKGLAPICVSCECQRNIGKEDITPMTQTHDTEDSDSDSDDEGSLPIEHLLRLLERHMTRATSASQLKAMVRLISSHTISEDITASQVTQLQNLLRKSKPELREGGLLMIKQLCSNPSSALVLAKKDIFNDLLTVLSSPHSIKVQVAALRAAEQLFLHASVAEELAEAVEEVFLPVLLRVLYSEHPLEMKYSSCCVLRALSLHPCTACLVGQELLFIVKELKESSSKMKEVFVEIVINLYRQTDVVYPDMIDRNILQSTSAMIVDGPCGVQNQALYLVLCLVEDANEVASVLRNRDLMMYVLQCMKDSQCRKVRQVSTRIVQTICSYHKPTIARTMMELLAAFFHPEEKNVMETFDGCGKGLARVVYPVRVKHQAESRNWQSLEEFLSLLGLMIRKEGMMEENASSHQLLIDDKPTSEWNVFKLGCLAALVSTATNLCHWPIDKSKNPQKLDLYDLTDDENLRNKLKYVNRQMTSEVWSSCGRQVSVLLSKFSEKVRLRCNPLSARPNSKQKHRPLSPVSPRRGRTPRGEILSPAEINLVKSLLEFFFIISVASCTNKKNIKQDIVVEKQEREITQRPKEALWVIDNPFLTQSIDRRSTSEGSELMERRQRELSEKEASTERRLLRKGLFEADLFRTVSPFVGFDNEDLRVTAALILRFAIQPLEEKIVPQNLYNMAGSSSGTLAALKPRMRPQSARTHQEREKKMNIALHRMSPDVASIIKKAIGPRPSSASSADHNYMNHRNKPIKPVPEANQPLIDLTQPIAHQCRKVTVENCGGQLLQGLFSKSRDVRKSCLLLIHDLVNHGNVETHMQLSELGCIPQLIDFLRINEEDDMLEIIAIIITRMMVTSDHRLKQLFNRHGGSDLLLSLSQNCSGVLKEEVKTTLRIITQGASRRTRPVSAPAARSPQKDDPDIWENIMKRWEYEDKVVKVFQKWI